VHANLSLATFDRTERITAKVARPEAYRQLFQAVASQERTIARGSGLSYSAASFDSDACSIDLTRFDRILGFDASSGQVRLEPGVQIGTLTHYLARLGRQLPAMPGYPTVTIGGCVAFDVHGKSQFHSGNFGDWVEALTLHHRDHGELECSRQVHPELFELTLGGMGLTGIITCLTLRTSALPAPNVEIRRVPVGNLTHAATVMQEQASGAACIYSWNDLNRSGDRFGAGTVYVEQFVDRPCKPSSPRARVGVRAELAMPGWNRWTTRLALGVYGRMQGDAATVVTLHEAMFPIHGKELYYVAFGHRGFREYQLIVPLERWPEFAAALQELLSRSRVPITLGSLKLFRGAKKFLRFSAPGICVALDVPAGARALALFEALDLLALAHGATVNLSKDSRLGRETCERVFPGYGSFRDQLLAFDPKRRCQSRLRELTGV
jgi:decaprenylphospho-beta-D-ribofuranose 2-oxidase